MSHRQCLSVMMTFVIVLICMAQAEFYPHRIYRERKKSSLDFGWKFFKGDATGNPYDPAFDDAGWTTVNIPHSASYDAPTPEGERGAHQGVCWYRKTFTVPAAKHTGKLFIEFEAAMQTADVWLNGVKLGTHDNCGYTWFSFDITDNVSLTEPNLLAVRLDNQFSAKIPPGCAGVAASNYPDYYLYSGLYRDVWLVTTNKCYMPLYSQKISVPKETVSAAQASVRVETMVKNDDAAQKTVVVQYYIIDSSNTQILYKSVAANVAPGQSCLLDHTLGPIETPQLWSTEKPYLYKLFTKLLVEGQPVDDNVERFGIRWYDWTAEGGFSLNGVPTIIRGANLHQSIAWIENALPTSRFFKEVAMVKEMGANLIRGAHFPRDPSFYNACDELGMMSMVEVPTWGTKSASYPDSFWIRQNEVVREMIEVGYNHPSIMIWGLFNEPLDDYSKPNQIPLLNKTAHAIDATRLTYMANNAKNSQRVFQADVVGLNYGLDLQGDLLGKPALTFNSEYHEGWLYWCFRGGENDNTQPEGYANERWKRWQEIVNYSGPNKLAGGCMWSFNDYWSPFMDHPMGVVDHYRIPKAVYYLFRKEWTGVEGDYPVEGITPTKLVLTSDMEKLIADSTDVAILTATLRDANGACAFIGKINSGEEHVEGTPITYTITGPADYFGNLTVQSLAGKAPLMIKTKNTAGVINVTATADNLGMTSNTVTINSIDIDNSPIPFNNLKVEHQKKNPVTKKTVIKKMAGKMIVSFPSTVKPENMVVLLMNIKGQLVTCPLNVKTNKATFDLRALSEGFYIVSVKNTADNTGMTQKLLVTKQY